MNRIVLLIIAISGLSLIASVEKGNLTGEYLSPTHICVSDQMGQAYVSLSTSGKLAVIDLKKNKLKEYIDLPFNPGGSVLLKDSGTIIVADKKPEGGIHFVSLESGEIIASIPTGHTPDAIAVTSDGSLLFVANRFSNTISVIDPLTRKLIKSIKVNREPFEIAVSPDDHVIAVANLLPNSSSTDSLISAEVNLIDTGTLEKTADIKLAHGSQSIRGLAFSDDGKYVYASHILSRNNLPTSQIQHGWINSNAVSVIDVEKRKYLTSFLLDNYNRGAANPAGMVLTGDGNLLCVALYGVHELCLIELPKLNTLVEEASPGNLRRFPNDLMALNGIKTRLPIKGRSPRYLADYNGKILVSSYFSTFTELIEDVNNPADIKLISLGNENDMDSERRGEMYFSDASLCFQEWQSCTSCHPDGRADGLNWDLLNDGAGNPKSGKSLLYSHYTPPVMITGIRDNAETAVRAGIKYILFSSLEESVAISIDTYLSSQEEVPSPYLQAGRLSEKAEKGKGIFEKAGCADCHSGKYHTDLQKYNVGTGEGVHENEKFDVPTLSEVWRTAPYLYDGRAGTMTEVFTRFNPSDEHGATGNLNQYELDCLVEYVLSL